MDGRNGDEGKLRIPRQTNRQTVDSYFLRCLNSNISKIIIAEKV
jgi:hypothetical protein